MALEQHWEPLGPLGMFGRDGDPVYTSISTHWQAETASLGPRPTVKPVHDLHVGKRLVAMAVPKHTTLWVTMPKYRGFQLLSRIM